jgi:hypothetical protein
MDLINTAMEFSVSRSRSAWADSLGRKFQTRRSQLSHILLEHLLSQVLGKELSASLALPRLSFNRVQQEHEAASGRLPDPDIIMTK